MRWTRRGCLLRSPLELGREGHRSLKKVPCIEISRMFEFLRRLGLLGAVGVVGAAWPTSASAQRSPSAQMSAALALIERHYVEATEPETLVQGAIAGMLASLDPHSALLPTEAAQTFSEDTNGRFGGIGVEVIVDEGRLRIVNVFDGGPAAQAGIQPGDEVRAVNGARIEVNQLVRIIQDMRGAPGTILRLTIQRGDPGESHEMTLVREIIRVRAVDARLLADDTLYIALKAFQRGAAAEVAAAFNAANQSLGPERGVAGILLDLRNNAGGLVDEARQLADLFLETGVIVSTQGRDGKVLSRLQASRRGTLPALPLLVLVNHFSASAAEIVASALQDHGRARLVGTRTFGKGSVQDVFELDGLGLMKLTVALYVTPLGRVIQASGVVPDFVIPALDPTASEKLSEALLREGEADLPRHLEAPLKPRTRKSTPKPDMSKSQVSPLDLAARESLRRSPDFSTRARPSFPSDFQAQIAHQLLLAQTREASH